MSKNVAVIGASGALGSAFVSLLSAREDVSTIHAFSRSIPNVSVSRCQYHTVDILDESSIEAAARIARDNAPFDMVLVTIGMLHDNNIQPEKALRDISASGMAQVLAVNTIAPALLMKHFLPLLSRDRRALFGVLSARVGSISDNTLGGWYSYRASKAALNMVVKNAAIEMARKYPQTIVAGLHPGTVDSALSKPFQSHVSSHKLFSPVQAAGFLLQVLEGLTPEHSGKCFAWDGQEVPA